MRRSNFYLEDGEARYAFSGAVRCKAHPCVDSDTVKTLWNGFCYSASTIEFDACGAYEFVIGEKSDIAPKDGAEYAICVTERGATVVGVGESELLRGVMSLLEMIEPDGDRLALPVCRKDGVPTLAVRMVHLCVFPETTLDFVRKFTRLAGVLKYSHIVYEFWGTLKFDCLPELAWKNAFSKEDILPILKEARELGMEPVPMLNHLGHASFSRGAHGKHVVLDQRPDLQRLFTKDGWIWNIKSDEVKALLGKVRGELCGLFGDGKYFFIGCDEAYMFGHRPEYAELFGNWVKYLADDLEKVGRRAVMWGDMLLSRSLCGAEGRYYCNCADEKSAELLYTLIDRRVVIADWQYDIFKAPVVTTEFLAKKGYDVLCCPWKDYKNVVACTDTAKACGAMGVVQTTWHTLSTAMLTVTLCSRNCWEPDLEESSGIDVSADTAALMRRVFRAGDYASAGWAESQVGVFY